MVSEFYLLIGHDKEENKEITVCVLDEEPTKKTMERIRDTWQEMQCTNIRCAHMVLSPNTNAFIVKRVWQ